jgi:Domain of unknown function (DUF4386)
MAWYSAAALDRPTAASTRTLARIAGVLFILTFITAIAARLLFDPVRNDADYIVGDGADTQIFLGAALELFLIITNIGTAVVLFPLLRRQSEALALGYVTARLVECSLITIGLVSILSVVTLRQDAAGADPDSLVLAGQSLVAVYDWTFLFGPGFLAGVGNGLILGYLMYKSGLVPRRMALLGLVGGPLLAASGLLILFGAFDAGSAAQGVMSSLEIAWEASLGIYMTFVGFKASSPLFSASRAEESAPTPVVAAR